MTASTRRTPVPPQDTGRGGPRTASRSLGLTVGVLATLAVTLGAAACSGSGGSDGNTSNDSAGGSSVSRASSAAQGRAEAAVAGAPAAQNGAVAIADTPGDAVAGAVQPAVIATGDVELRSGDVARAVFDVRRIVDAQQGSVQKESTDTDERGAPRFARLVVRVPTAGFETAMQQLGRAATLESTSSNSKDVTTAVLDNKVRVQVERRSIDRISTLLDQATSIKDVIAIEGQLSQRQADLASLEQTGRYLADQTSMATITVSVERTARATPPAPHDRHTGFEAGLGAGWGALRSAAVGLLTVTGALLPWLVVALGIGFPVLWTRRRLRHHGDAGPAGPDPGGEAAA